MKPLREFFLRGSLYFFEVSQKYDFLGEFFVWFTRDGEIEGLSGETCYPTVSGFNVFSINLRRDQLAQYCLTFVMVSFCIIYATSKWWVTCRQITKLYTLVAESKIFLKLAVIRKTYGLFYLVR